MPALPQSNIHLDILMGRDESLDVSDFFGGARSTNPFDFIKYLSPFLKVWRVNHRWTSTARWRRSYGCNGTIQIMTPISIVQVWYVEGGRRPGLCTF